MKTKITLILSTAFLIFNASSAQTTLFTSNFEGCPKQTVPATPSSACGWSVRSGDDAAPNLWTIMDNTVGCTPINGTRSMTVLFGGQFAISCIYHILAPSNNIAYSSTPINAALYNTLNLNFRWKAGGNASNYAMAVYSTDALTWSDVSATQYHSQPSPLTVLNLPLPASLDGTQFYIGFRYIVGGGGDGNPFMVDDVVVTGMPACVAPTAPATPSTNSPQCANTGVTLTASGSPPPGITWYWQGTNASGTSTADNATSPYVATTSGTYYIRAYDFAGMCWSSVSGSVTVVVNSLPVVSLSVTPDTVCINTPASALTGGAPAGGSYSGPGVAFGFFDASAAGLGMHTLHYSYTDANNCTDSDSSQIFVDICTGIASFTEVEEFFISPNPAANEIRVESRSLYNRDKITSIEIYNTLGEKVYTKAGTSHSTVETINITALSSGIYFVRVRTSYGIRAAKFIKE